MAGFGKETRLRLFNGWHKCMASGSNATEQSELHQPRCISLIGVNFQDCVCKELPYDIARSLGWCEWWTKLLQTTVCLPIAPDQRWYLDTLLLMRFRQRQKVFCLAQDRLHASQILCIICVSPIDQLGCNGRNAETGRPIVHAARDIIVWPITIIAVAGSCRIGLRQRYRWTVLAERRENIATAGVVENHARGIKKEVPDQPALEL